MVTGIITLSTAFEIPSHAEIMGEFTNKNKGIGVTDTNPIPLTKSEPENPDCLFGKQFNKMFEWLRIEQISFPDSPLGEDIRKLNHYLQKRGIKVSEDRKDTQKIRISVKETAPESFKERIREQGGETSQDIEMHLLYKDGEPIGAVSQFSSGVFGASAVAEISHGDEKEENIIILKSDGIIEPIIPNKEEGDNKSPRTKRDCWEICKEMVGEICSVLPTSTLFWKRAAEIGKRCMSMCSRHLRFIRHPGALVGCSSLCAGVMLFGCKYGVRPICNFVC
ncbi:hypothetical protein [Pasteuria penetrans]|uniref:hypothetical protein n=1 Tax=Pasteuria penetrans TaxID=86005 RepID=UPI0011F088F3|nr:hypothetical protein [Pasteuria penetrans]